jgi:hypothetical protein
MAARKKQLSLDANVVFANIDGDALALAFDEADLPLVHPVHPKRLLRVLR